MKALITGITGQDGSYLAELLLHKGYEVHGIIRRSSTFNTDRIDHLYQDPHRPGVKIRLHYGDLSDAGQLTDIIYNTKPDEIYHLGAQSHVMVSFDMPEYTGDITGIGTIRLLEAIRRSGIKTRFYQASSSEMFGDASEPQSEESPFRPRSPYAAAKVYSYWIVRNYREAYGLYTCNGILFNHESPRRGETFVTRKITRGLAMIKAGIEKKVYLGNLDARRDWGYAPEFVEVMWSIVQQDKPEDYVIGTGEAHTVREFAQIAFDYASMDWEKHIAIDQRYIRPTDVESLRADPSKARDQLNWEPRVTFKELIMIMVDYDLERLGQECPGKGKAALAEKRLDWTKHEFARP
jgi:GDPmannose 4,6-dehydratase